MYLYMYMYIIFPIFLCVYELGLQHMLTTVDEGAVAGINGVEWDAVEFVCLFVICWFCV